VVARGYSPSLTCRSNLPLLLLYPPLFRLPSTLLFIMTRGKSLSNDLRAAIVNLAYHFDVADIVKYTKCKKRTVQRIVNDYKRHCTALRPRLERELRGARRSLSLSDVTVCSTVFKLFRLY
jgi:hypothetical protein